MNKKPSAFNKDIDDIELSDPELREIENMKSDDELGNLDNSGDVDLDALEQELNAMDDENNNHHGQPAHKNNQNAQLAAQPKPLPKNNSAKHGPNLDELEKEFHGVENMFGEMLEHEIEEVIPQLKKQYEGNDDEIDYFMALNKKEMELVKFKMSIMEKVKKGDIDEQKYLMVLEKIVDKNKAALQNAKTKAIPANHIARIAKRIETGQQEIDSIKNPPPEEPEPQPAPQITPQPKPLQPQSQPLPETKAPEKKDSFIFVPIPTGDFSNPNSTEPKEKSDVEQRQKSETQQAHPVLIHFAQKISFFMCFQDYLKKYFATERAADLKIVEDRIKLMKEALDRLKKDPSKKSIEQIDKEFPNLEPKFIIGMDRIERNKKIENIINDIQADIKTLKSAPLLEVYKTHYTPIIGKLAQVRDSTFSPMPIVSKKPFPIPTTDINKHIQSGEMILKFFKIRNVPVKRYFYLSYEFKYDEKIIRDETKYCDGIGIFNFEKRYLLDTGRINKRFVNEKITFTLHKKKFLVSSRLVSKAVLSLDKLKNYMDYKTQLEFDYKNNTKIYVDLEISIFKALEKPLKDIFLYVIEKQFPPFSLHMDKKPQKSDSTSLPTSDVEGKRPTVTEPEIRNPSNSTPQPPAQPKQPTINNHEEEHKPVSSSGFKFPILNAQQKKVLAGLVAKNNLPSIYLNYQDKIFCVTFLEELLQEIDSQINQFAENGDSESRKDAEEIMMNATKYCNYLNSKLESGEMTTADYKSKVDNFIKLDEANLPFFEKIKFADSVKFIKNRLEIMRNESQQLEEVIKQGN